MLKILFLSWDGILVSFQKELPGNSRAIPTRPSLPACGSTGSCFISRLTTFTDNWDLWRLSWPLPTCLLQGAQPGGRSCIQWWPMTTAWGRATDWPRPTTQKALLTRWQPGEPSRCNYTTLKSCCHCWLPFNIGRKRKGPPVLMSFKRNSPFTSVLQPPPRTKLTSRSHDPWRHCGYAIQKLPPTQQFPTVSNLAYGNSCAEWKAWINIRWYDTRTLFLMCLHLED